MMDLILMLQYHPLCSLSWPLKAGRWHAWLLMLREARLTNILLPGRGFGKTRNPWLVSSMSPIQQRSKFLCSLYNILCALWLLQFFRDLEFPLLLLLLLSRFSCVRPCATPEMAAHKAPLSLGFSRQEHWSGLPFPSPLHESEKWKWSH